MLGEFYIALGWTDWRLFFPPVDIEEELIDMAVATKVSMDELWRWPTALRRHYSERFLKYQKAVADTITKAGRIS